MTSKIKSMFSRITAQCLKPAFAIFAALAVGGAWANYFNEWNGGSGSVSYWDGVNSWVASNSDPNIDDWRIGLSGAQVGFRNSVITSDSAGLYIYGAGGANDTPVEFSAEKDSDGLTKNGVLDVGVWFGGNAALTVKNGTHTFTEINIGRWSNTGVLQLEGGNVTSAGNVYIGYSVAGTLVVGGGILNANGIYGETTGGITLNGGTLAVAEIGPNMTITANGGTIDVGANSVTIAATVTGSGTITKKGSGMLTFTGDMSEFTGSIVVVEGGAVTVSETGTSATAGVGTTKTDLIFTTDGTTYSWVGGGTPNEDGSYNWTDLQNWSLNGSEPTAYPGSTGASDSQTTEVVYFPGSNAVTVKLTGSAYTKNVLLAGPVSLTGGGTLFARTISGDELTLAGATLRGYQNAKSFADNGLTIACDLVIAESTENSLYLGRKSDNQYCVGIELTGALSGKGVLKIVEERDRLQYVKVSDASEFEGSWIATSTEITDTTRFTDAKQVGRTASYTFNKPYHRNYYAYPFAKQGETFYIGALNGIVYLRGNSDDNARNMTLVIGERNEACSFGGEMSVSSSHKNHIKKVGTETLTYTGTQFTGNLTIEDGTFIIGSENSAPGKIVFAGGALSEAQGIDIDPITKFAADGSTTAAVVIDDWGYPHEWSGALTPERVPNGFTKKGSGTLTLTTSPTYTSKTSIENGTLVIPSGTTLGELFISDGAHLFISGGDGDTITVGSFTDGDTTKGRVIVAGDSAISFVYDENSGKYVGTISRADLTYTWNGSAGSAWDDINNWTVTKTEGGDVVSLSAVNVTEVDTVVFPEQGAPWSVGLSSDQTMGSVAFYGQTSLSGGVLFSSGYKGEGKVVLGDDAGLGNNDIAITIANKIEIAGTGVHTNKLYANGKNLTVSGALSGSGNLNLVASVDSIGVLLTGDNKMTSGSIVVEPALANSARRNCSTIKPNSSNSNLVWKVSNGANNKHTGGNYSFLNGEGTYYFGSINNINQPAGLKNSIVEIGALVAAAETCAVGGVFFSVDSQVSERPWNSQYTSTTLRKVGAGTVSTSMQSIYNYDVVAGTLELAVDNARPAADGTIKFSGNGTLALNDAFTYDVSTNIAAVTASTPYPITVDTGTTPRTWEVAIPNNYTGGFTKKGAGTLTLSAAPTYTGDTAVEAGVLYIVDTYTPTLAAGAVKMVSDKAGYNKFVPASAAVAHVGDVYYPTFAAAWAAAGSDENAAWVYLDAALAQDDVVTLDTAWQRVRVANGAYSAENNIAISGSLANVALKTSAGADMTEYTAYPTVTVTVVPGAGVASGEIAAGYISKDGAAYTIYSGSEVTITWTAAEGYEFAGKQSIATTVISPTENVTPECPTASVIKNVTINTPASVTYGADFATATVTVELAGEATSGDYMLTVGENTYNATASNGSVTFENVATGHKTAYDSFSYTVTSDDVTVSGDAASGSKKIADEAAWFSTSASETTGGSWNVSPWANGGVVTSDNSFTPVASDASVVDVSLQVCFGDANDDEIDLTGASAAVKIATVKVNDVDTLVFQALHNGTFVTLTGGDAPNAETTYNVALHLDYAARKYTVKIGDTMMQYNNSELLAMPSTATAMSAVAFAGQGTLTSLVGETSEGYVAMDDEGTRYLTLDAALASEKSVTMLHAGTYGGTAYAKSDKVAPAGATNVPVEAASREAAAASVKVALTAAQIQQGLKTSYYKTVAKESGVSGMYDVAITLDESAVAPTVAADTNNKAMDTTESGVSLNVSDAKMGLYYGIAVGDSSNLGMSDVAGGMVKCTEDGSLKLSNAALPTSGVKYYKVIVSDVGNN